MLLIAKFVSRNHYSLKIQFHTTLQQYRSINMKLISSSKSFGGEQRVYSHESKIVGCEMKLGVYVPPAALDGKVKCPVLYYLSGLTCTHENFLQKSGVQQHASKHNLIIVNPDTSPRGLNIPGEEDSYDFGTGAGFYVDALVEPYSKNYKMYSYVTKELPELVEANLPGSPTKCSIFGHSMGGHGALICALKNPGMFCSVSAFAPICNPIKSQWGQKALKGYMGENEEVWKEWDASCLAKAYSGPSLNILQDQGDADEFLEQLLPENLTNAAADNSHLQITYKMREGYNHSYFYIATFIGEHIDFHAKFLNA